MFDFCPQNPKDHEGDYHKVFNGDNCWDSEMNSFSKISLRMLSSLFWTRKRIILFLGLKFPNCTRWKSKNVLTAWYPKIKLLIVSCQQLNWSLLSWNTSKKSFQLRQFAQQQQVHSSTKWLESHWVGLGQNQRKFWMTVQHRNYTANFVPMSDRGIECFADCSWFH